MRSAQESRSQRLEDSAREVLISHQPLSVLWFNTIPQLPARRFVSHPSSLHQQWLGDSQLIRGTWAGREDRSITGVPGLFGVGQSGFSFLLTLCMIADLESIWWERKNNILTPVLLPDPSLPTSNTCAWQFPSPKGIAVTGEGIPWLYPRTSLTGKFFFSKANVLAFIIQQAVELFSLTSP